METRDPTGLAKVTKVLLWAWLGFDVALAGSALFTILVLGGLGGGIREQSALELSDGIGGLVGIGYTLAFLAAGVVTLRWTYVTNRNAHALSDWPTVSPGGSVGWYFVPFANLFKPFGAMREAWQASMDPANPGLVPVPPVMRWWWGAWIATSIIGNLTFRLSMAAKTPEELIVASWLTFASTPFDIVCTVALTTIIARLSSAQASRLATPELVGA